MGHLLLVESWVGAMSSLLPNGIHHGGHRFSLVTRDMGHYLRPATDPAQHPLLAAENVLGRETNDADGLMRSLAAVQPALEFDGVTSSCDYYLVTAARLAERLGLPGPPAEAVQRACAKDLTRITLHESGIPGPRFAFDDSVSGLERAATEMGFPLVVKPVDLCAGMFVRRVDDLTQLREAVAAIEGFPVNARGQRRRPVVLLEEMLAGREVSVETVTFDGRTTVIGVTDKTIAGAPWFIETGHMFPADLKAETERDAATVAVAAVEALGLDNTVCHTEVKLTESGPRIVEVNPRPAGNRITELIWHVTGIDLAAVYAQVALGEKPDLRPRDTGVGSAAISFLLPPRPGPIEEIRGIDALADPAVTGWRVKPAGHHAGLATSNNTYLADVMVACERPGVARAKAESLVAGLDVRYAEATT